MICHIKDILVFGESNEVHDTRLQSVLQTLQNTGLTLNQAKCEFEKEEIVILGYEINLSGLRQTQRKSRQSKAIQVQDQSESLST